MRPLWYSLILSCSNAEGSLSLMHELYNRRNSLDESIEMMLETLAQQSLQQSQLASPMRSQNFSYLSYHNVRYANSVDDMLTRTRKSGQRKRIDQRSKNVLPRKRFKLPSLGLYCESHQCLSCFEPSEVI